MRITDLISKEAALGYALNELEAQLIAMHPADVCNLLDDHQQVCLYVQANGEIGVAVFNNGQINPSGKMGPILSMPDAELDNSSVLFTWQFDELFEEYFKIVRQ